ncbi:MAG: YsnF/AvaK domain-containing protein, partial [Thermoproteota archaeon]|nr:YsnF/AvaK domain-containing protein [Thermoproteota archaeon]
AESFDGDILKLRVSESELESYEQTEDQKFDDYSTFKASDMSREVETTIPLMAEDLEVTKRVTEDKVDIIKEPVRETRTVEIELTHEKITIERRPVTSDSYSGNDVSSEQSSSSIEGPVETRTEISIPVKREEPVITKKPYVKEEIVIRKKPVTETRTITEEVTHEEVANKDIIDNKDNQEENPLAEKQ